MDVLTKIDGTLNGDLANNKEVSGTLTADRLTHIGGDLTKPLILHKYENDYEKLINHPSINGIELLGDRALDAFGNIVTVETGTTDDLKDRSGETSGKNVLYVWSNYNGENQPGISIGDGNAYIGDLPVISGMSETLIDHIKNAAIHVSKQDRTDWDSKISCDVDGDTLVFTT